MIRILHCVSKMDRAGQETFIMNVYRQIDREKFQFYFLCTNHSKGDFDDEIKELGGKIFYLPQNKIFSGVNRYLKQIEILAVWLADNKKDFDIVHLHTYHALDVFVHLEAARRAKIKNVVIHSHNTNGPHKVVHYIFRIVNNMYKHRMLACSEEAGKWLHGNINMKKGRVGVAYNGIDVPSFKYNEDARNDYRRILNIQGKKVIGHIGRFNYQKNHDFIIEIMKSAIKINKDIVLLLIGKGERFEEIKQKVNNEKLDKNIIILGSRDDIPELLSTMDALLFPSLFEGLSVVLVEAQASGLQCLISDNILPPEEDVVKNIFTKCSLKENSIVWAKKLLSIVEKNEQRIVANHIMEQSQFNILSTVNYLEDFYSKQV